MVTLRTLREATEAERIKNLRDSDLKSNWVDSSIWWKLVKRENGKCLCCLKEINYGTGASIHHLMPRSRGGSRSIDNLVLICPTCHDKLEYAQEAKLAVTNIPPKIHQLIGIFEENEITQGTITKEVNVISRGKIKEHAMRGLRVWKNPKVMLEIALREKRWPHIDWNFVQKKLGV